MKTALVVDDSEAVRAVVDHTLRAIGYSVVEAATSTDALAILTSGNMASRGASSAENTAGEIVLMISDLNLGEESSGATLIREAQRLYPGLKCILMSGSKSPRQSLRTPYPVLSKPFGPKELADAIDKLTRDNSTDAATC